MTTGTAPADSEFDTAFAKPADCVHVIWVRYNQSGATGGSNVPILYQILNNQIVVNLFGQQPGVTPPPTFILGAGSGCVRKVRLGMLRTRLFPVLAGLLLMAGTVLLLLF